MIRDLFARWASLAPDELTFVADRHAWLSPLAPLSCSGYGVSVPPVSDLDRWVVEGYVRDLLVASGRVAETYTGAARAKARCALWTDDGCQREQGPWCDTLVEALVALRVAVLEAEVAA